MKKLLLVLFSAVLLLSCSADEVEITGNLNIPEVFRGRLISSDEVNTAIITQTYLKVDGVKTITNAESEEFNGSNHYEAELANDEKLVLLYGNDYVGITIYDSDGNWIISKFFYKE